MTSNQKIEMTRNQNCSKPSEDFLKCTNDMCNSRKLPPDICWSLHPELQREARKSSVKKQNYKTDVPVAAMKLPVLDARDAELAKTKSTMTLLVSQLAAKFDKVSHGRNMLENRNILEIKDIIGNRNIIENRKPRILESGKNYSITSIINVIDPNTNNIIRKSEKTAGTAGV